MEEAAREERRHGGGGGREAGRDARRDVDTAPQHGVDNGTPATRPEVGDASRDEGRIAQVILAIAVGEEGGEHEDAEAEGCEAELEENALGEVDHNLPPADEAAQTLPFSG